MKAHHIFLATCIAAFTLTSCEKEALPEIKTPKKNPFPEFKTDLLDPADEVERDNINLGRPEPVDLKSHERRGPTVIKDNFEVIDYTDRMDTTIRNTSVSVELQQHERRGALNTQVGIRSNTYTNAVMPTKPLRKAGSEKVELISHQ